MSAGAGEPVVAAGDLIILSAPSGSGKTTLSYLLVERMEGIVFSRSTTTRPARSDEQDGVDYDFVSDEEFDRMVEAGRFLEWAVVHGNRYGTPEEFVDATRARGLDIVLNIDIQGALAVRDRRPDAVLIFILPPSFAELRRRLLERAPEERQEVKRRLQRGLEEVDAVGSFDYVIVNEVVEDALRDLMAIVRARRRRRERMEPRTRPILESLAAIRDRGVTLE